MTFAELGDLQPVTQHDRVAADQIDPADMRIEVDADARPVEPCCDLLDMRRFSGAVITLHHHPAVERKAREDRQRGVRIEHIGVVKIGHALVRLAERWRLHVDVEPEHLAHADGLVRRIENRLSAAVGLDVGNVAHGIDAPIRAAWRLQ